MTAASFCDLRRSAISWTEFPQLSGKSTSAMLKITLQMALLEVFESE